MEGLNEGAKNVLFLVGLKGIKEDGAQVIKYINLIQQKCKNTNAIFYDEQRVCRDHNDPTDRTNERMAIINHSDTSHLQLQEQWLSQAGIVFLVDMTFGAHEASGVLSKNSLLVLEHLSRPLLQIFCLHSVSMLEMFSSEKDNMSRSVISALTKSFQDISIIHMIGDPKQVLRLMSWSVGVLSGLTKGLMMKAPGSSCRSSCVDLEDSNQANDDMEMTQITSYSVSEVFYPLFAPGIVLPEGSNKSMSDTEASMDVADTMLSMSSPERRNMGNKRYYAQLYQPMLSQDASGPKALSTNSSTSRSLKRSHTLASTRECINTAEKSELSTSDTQHGRPLRRSISEKAAPSHPPRPPSYSKSGKESIMVEDNFSNESGSFGWASWRSDGNDRDSQCYSSPQSLPDSQRSHFRHIFSQEDSSSRLSDLHDTKADDVDVASNECSEVISSRRCNSSVVDLSSRETQEQIEKSKSESKKLDRQLSFLTSSQATALQEDTSSFSFMSGL